MDHKDVCQVSFLLEYVSSFAPLSQLEVDGQSLAMSEAKLEPSLWER